MTDDLEGPGPDSEEGDEADYFVDMIEQLAERARGLGQIEIAIHLDAAAKARRYTLGSDAGLKGSC
jgi:hypothetical protein